MNQDFKRSRRFGLVGVGVVAALAAAIALVYGSGSAHPTGALIAILALVFGFVAVLIVLQRRDLDAAAGRAVAAGSGPVADPTLVDSGDLLGDLAIGPIDDAALAAAGGRTWGIARTSINGGAVIIVLIFCAVVPWILFTFVWSLVVFVPIIVAYAVYLAARLLRPGGTLERAYDDSAATLAPLGLELAETPTVTVEQRTGSPGAEARLKGAVAYAGERHGRPVSIRIAGACTVTLGGAVEEFTVRSRGERLRAADGAPAAVVAVLEALRPSSFWNGVTASGGSRGVTVQRGRNGGERLDARPMARRASR